MTEVGKFWRTAAQRRLNRRMILTYGGAAGAGLAALALAGCGSKSGSGSKQKGGANAQNQPKRGGNLVLPLNFQQGFDPHIVTVSQTSTYGYFYQNLVRTNPRTYQVEPEIAQKWESPSPTEIVFTIAPNVAWHNKPPANGRPLKVDDIIFSYNRAKTNDPRFIYKSGLASIDKMEATSANTLKLTLKGPNAYQLGNLAIAGLKILAPEVVDAAKGNFGEAATAVGTGAFVLQSRELNVGSVMVRNPSYWKPGLPYLDRIDGRVFQDLGSQWSAFLAGRTDKDVVPGDQSSDIETKHKDQYNLDWNGDQAGYMLIANTKRKPLDDARVTRALRLLVDHTEYKNAWAAQWFGRGRFASIFPAALENWDLTEDEYSKYLEYKTPKDDAVKEAVSLLTAAGVSKDKPLKFTIAGVQTGGGDYNTASRQLVQAQFKRLGQGLVEPDLQGFEEAAFTPLRASGQFDYYAAGNSPGGIQPDDWFSDNYQTGGSRNYGKMSDSKLDQMIENQRTILDENQRKKAIRDIIIYMLDTSPYTFQAGVFDLNASKKDVMATPPEGKSFKWSEHYELVWRNS
ncbi:MAG TPA: ABC transporter substrate-binding protein [Dehalococcoidia bacterium]|nr:ABC transporter substrate-binding protein [Dehalococcoidia bacterium]